MYTHTHTHIDTCERERGARAHKPRAHTGDLLRGDRKADVVPDPFGCGVDDRHRPRGHAVGVGP